MVSVATRSKGGHVGFHALQMVSAAACLCADAPIIKRKDAAGVVLSEERAVEISGPKRHGITLQRAASTVGYRARACSDLKRIISAPPFATGSSTQFHVVAGHHSGLTITQF